MLWNGNDWKETKVIRILRQLFPLNVMIDQNQRENVEYFDYFHSVITNNAR